MVYYVGGAILAVHDSSSLAMPGYLQILAVEDAQPDHVELIPALPSTADLFDSVPAGVAKPDFDDVLHDVARSR